MYTKKLKLSLQIFFSVLLCFLLCACQTNHTDVIPSEPFRPTQPTQLKQTPEQLLENYPIDDTHDAFLVNTGGEIGTLLVTVEWDEANTTNEFSALLHFSIWNPNYMNTPFQTMDADSNCFHRSNVIDINFDGYMDFSYTYAMGNQPYYEYAWIWDENNRQFVQEPEFETISCASFDTETKTIYGFARSSAGGTGLHTFHQWIDGKLTCIRRIEIDWIYQDNTILEINTIRMSIQDRIDNELTEIYYKDYSLDSLGWLEDITDWCDLDYHGEPS